MKCFNRLMLIACALITCLASSLANATITRLTSYNELLTALKNGHHVSAVADNSKCKVTNGAGKRKASDPDLSMVIGLSFNSNFFILYRDEGDSRNYLATMAANTIGNTGTGAKIRYKRIRIFDDNSAELYTYISELRSGNELGGLQTACALSNGHDQNGMSLFDYDA
jgi:hypothetical protein